MHTPMSEQTLRYRKLTLLGYFSLFLLMPSWQLFLAPNPEMSTLFYLALFWLPLWFPLPGIIKGKAYTHAWSNFILCYYFLHSTTTFWAVPEERWLAGLEFIFTSMAFVGATAFAKRRGRELGIGLKKDKAKDKIK